MMFSTETNLLSISLKQFVYKLKASSFVGLIIMQIIVLLLTSSGTSMYGASSGDLMITIKSYSADIVFICTLIWIFIMALLQTKDHHKNMDFTFVTNRLTSCLSDMGLLLTFSILGGLTASLSSMLLRVILYFTAESGLVMENSFRLPITVLLYSIGASILYFFLLSGIGYLFGMMIEVHKLFAFILPGIFLGLARTETDFLKQIVSLVTKETSFLLFTWKVLLLTMILYGLSMTIYNRMEVRR